MNKFALVISLFCLILSLASCGGRTAPDHQRKWSKPEPILEGCDGVMQNSKQCQDNPNNQQMMIKIENK